MNEQQFSDDPITLSLEHSRRLRAFQHLVPWMTIEEIIEELAFAGAPSDYLEGVHEYFEGEKHRRLTSLIFPDGKYERMNDWEALLERVKTIPPYDPANYPEPKPRNVVELAPHLHLVK